ncbi:hypothetical protein [Gallaecimonas pentaromativorans]|uniref:hypothetical protein n=1 Tax=Gallaecimonas pentaromativorans TaxID=584787 RepID=UPI003A8D90BC
MPGTPTYPVRNIADSIKIIEKQFKENQVDVYALTSVDFFLLWVELQRKNGLLDEQIKQRLKEISPIEVSDFVFGKLINYGSAAIDVKTAYALAMDMKRSGKVLGRIYVESRGGKDYIIFKGHPALRKILTGTRYLATNTKILQMGIGNKALRAGAKDGVLLTVFFSITMNTIDWMFKDEFRWTNWIATISTDLVKAAIASLAGCLAGVAIGLMTTIAIIPLAISILVAIAIGFTLNAIDNHFGITRSLIDKLNKFEARRRKDLREGVDYLIESVANTIRKELSYVISSYIRNCLSKFSNGPLLR